MKNALRTAVLTSALKQSFIADHDMPHCIRLYINKPPVEDRISLQFHEAHVQFADVLLHVDFYGIENSSKGKVRSYSIEFNDYPEMYDCSITWINIPKNKKDIPMEIARFVLEHLRLWYNYEPESLEYKIAPFD